jgi:hypothetical protein
MAEEEEEYNEEIFESIGGEEGELKKSDQRQKSADIELDEVELPEISELKDQISKIPSRFPQLPDLRVRHDSSFSVSNRKDNSPGSRQATEKVNEESNFGSSYQEEASLQQIEDKSSLIRRSEMKKKESFEVNFEESLKNFLDPGNDTNMAYSEICDSNFLRSSLKLKIQQQMQEQHQNAAVTNFNTNNKLDSSSLSRIQSNSSKNDEELSVHYSSNLSNNESLSYSISRNPSAMPHTRVSNRQLSDKEKGRISTPKQGNQEPETKEIPAEVKNNKENKDTQKKRNTSIKRPQSGTSALKTNEDTKGGKMIDEDKGKGAKKNMQTVRPSSVSSKDQAGKKITEKKPEAKKSESSGAKPEVKASEETKKITSGAKSEQKTKLDSQKNSSSGIAIRISKPNSSNKITAVSQDNYMDFIKKKMEAIKQQEDAQKINSNTGILDELKQDGELFQEEEVAAGDEALPEMMPREEPREIVELEKVRSVVEKMQKTPSKGDIHKKYVKTIIENHKKKIQKMQELEDDIFVKEELEKRKAKGQAVNNDNQKKDLEKKEKNWVVRPISAGAFGKPQPVTKKTDDLLKEASKKMGKTLDLGAEKKDNGEGVEKIKTKSQNGEEPQLEPQKSQQSLANVYIIYKEKILL